MGQSEAQFHELKTGSSLLQEITSYKFEGIYLNLICLLARERGEIYHLAIKNLATYCCLSSNKFNNVEQVEEIMKVIMSFIVHKNYLRDSLQTYKAVLERAREVSISKTLTFLK